MTMTAEERTAAQDAARALARARQLQAQARARMQPAQEAQPGAPPSAMTDEGRLAQRFAAQRRAAEEALMSGRYGEPAAPSPDPATAQRPAVGDAGGMTAAAADGVLMGFGDEYLAGLSAVLGVQPDGQGGADWFRYGRPIRERYGVALDAIRDEQAAYAEARPGRALGAEVAGALIGPGKAGGGFIAQGSTRGAQIGRGAAVGGAAGAAYGYGEGEGGVDERAVGAAQGAPLGALGGGAVTLIGQGFGRAAQALRGRPDAAETVPTLAELRGTAQHLYGEAERSGVRVPDGAVRALGQRARQAVTAEGFDADLHPRVAAVLRRLDGEGGAKSLSEMETLRRVASNAAQSLQPDERRLASRLLDEIDDAVEALGDGGQPLRDARSVWSRTRRLERVEGAIERAALHDDFAAGLRTQFKGMLRSGRQLRGFSADEIRTIQAVANGTAGQKALRGLGKLLSVQEVSGAALLGAAVFGGSGPGSLAIPVAGYAARRASRGMTEEAAQRARDAVARGPEGARAMTPPPVPGAALAAPMGLLSASGALGGFGAAHAAPAPSAGLLGALEGFHGGAGPAGGASGSPRDALVRALAALPPEAPAQRSKGKAAVAAALLRRMEGRR